MGKGNKTGLFKDVEYSDPIFAGRLHADFGTGILCKPSSQFFQAFGKGRKAGLFIYGDSVSVGDSDAGINPCFVDVKPTAVITKDLEQ